MCSWMVALISFFLLFLVYVVMFNVYVAGGSITLLGLRTS